LQATSKLPLFSVTYSSNSKPVKKTKKPPKKNQHIQKNSIFENKTKENMKGFKMLIITKITHRKNSLNRKLQLPLKKLVLTAYFDRNMTKNGCK